MFFRVLTGLRRRSLVDVGAQASAEAENLGGSTRIKDLQGFDNAPTPLLAVTLNIWVAYGVSDGDLPAV